MFRVATELLDLGFTKPTSDLILQYSNLEDELVRNFKEASACGNQDLMIQILSQTHLITIGHYHEILKSLIALGTQPFMQSICISRIRSLLTCSRLRIEQLIPPRRLRLYVQRMIETGNAKILNFLETEYGLSLASLKSEALSNLITGCIQHRNVEILRQLLQHPALQGKLDPLIRWFTIHMTLDPGHLELFRELTTVWSDLMTLHNAALCLRRALILSPTELVEYILETYPGTLRYLIDSKSEGSGHALLKLLFYKENLKIIELLPKYGLRPDDLRVNDDAIPWLAMVLEDSRLIDFILKFVDDSRFTSRFRCYLELEE